MEFLMKTFFWICIYTSTCYCSPECIDESGNAVDWYVLYKLPRIKGHINPNITQGTAYLFMTSETAQDGWKLSPYNISDPLSAPGKTISVAYSKEASNSIDDLFWLFYNDQPPNKNFTLIEGHTKGVVLGDENGGIWIVHSIPHFPQITALEYQYPSTGMMYGQSFLCVSLNKENLDDIGYQLMVNAANTYDYKFEGNLDKAYPNIMSAAKMDRTGVLQSKKQFASIQNVLFTSYAKSRNFGKDLYSKWVADSLKTELFVETWCHNGELPSDCKDSYEVHNVKIVKAIVGNCSFVSLKDHSKYAVSARDSEPWVCIGDINRQVTQYIRAGGTVCVKNEHLWRAYFGIIFAVEPCPK